MQIGKAQNPWSRFTDWVGQKVAAPSDFHSTLRERQRDTLVLTTTAGAAIGAAIGVAGGALSTAVNEKTEGVAVKEIVHPEFEGYTYWTREDTDEDCTTDSDGDRHCTEETDGWHHYYSPRYEERVVGSFEEPAFRNSHAWQPLTGGLLGAAAGGLVGLGVGVGMNLLRKSQAASVSISPRTRQEIAAKTSRNLTRGLAVGAGAGALAGGLAGLLEASKSQTVDRTWQVPSTTRELMGHIPPDSYEWSSWSWPEDRSDAAATEPVYRDVPVYDSQGRPKLESTTETFDTARFGPLSGALVGGVIGAGAGLAGGVAMGVLQKMAAYER